MTLWNETKSVPISHQMIWEAYKKVRSHQGGAGIDQISMEAYEKKRSRYLYQLWNRMVSGSYFPPPVREVEIPKQDGKKRKLGIPTISDRVGQMVIKEYLEARFEKLFSENSYAYQPNKNAHMALLKVRENCRISGLNPVFQLLRKRLVQWVRKRYKRYKTSLNKAYEWLERVRVQYPTLFYHWRLGFS